MPLIDLGKGVFLDPARIAFAAPVETGTHGRQYQLWIPGIQEPVRLDEGWKAIIEPHLAEYARRQQFQQTLEDTFLGQPGN